jgi:hypothetical protein
MGSVGVLSFYMCSIEGIWTCPAELHLSSCFIMSPNMFLKLLLW